MRVGCILLIVVGVVGLTLLHVNATSAPHVQQ